jgi:hypothetical protein
MPSDIIVKGKSGYRSRYAYVEFDTDDTVMPQRGGRRVAMTFLVPGGGVLELEELATELAELVEAYNPGKGQLAFDSAVMQLLTRDYDGEWEELNRKIRVHQLWGGQVPSAVLIPDMETGREWQLMLTDKNGLPTMYSVDQKKLDWASPPASDINAYQDENGQWRIKPAPDVMNIRPHQE